jgi:hypothetical protein
LHGGDFDTVKQMRRRRWVVFAALALLAGNAYADDDDDDGPLLGPLTWSFGVGGELAHTAKFDGLQGLAAVGELGYRFDGNATLGLRFAFRNAGGSYTPEFVAMTTRDVSSDVGLFVSATAFERVWGQVFIGAHFDTLHIEEDMADSTTAAGVGVGLGLGAMS